CQNRAALQRGRAVLDRQARHQDDRHAGMERSQRRGVMGDGRVCRKAAGDVRAGLRPSCHGKHGPWRRASLSFQYTRSCACGIAGCVAPDARPPMPSRRYPMEPKKFTLCPACTACPEVEITDQGVTIGERENTVRLSHTEWNQLVRLIKSGELSEV